VNRTLAASLPQTLPGDVFLRGIAKTILAPAPIPKAIVAGSTVRTTPVPPAAPPATHVVQTPRGPITLDARGNAVQTVSRDTGIGTALAIGKAILPKLPISTAPAPAIPAGARVVQTPRGPITLDARGNAVPTVAQGIGSDVQAVKAIARANFPAIYGAASGGRVNPLGIGLEAASVLPFGRAARAARAGIDVVRAGEAAAPAVRAVTGEGAAAVRAAQALKTSEAIKIEPPVAAGTTRLYRGEGLPRGGKLLPNVHAFSADRNAAEAYARGYGATGPTRYVDVPNAEVGKYAGENTGEYVLPREVAKGARRIQPPAQQIRQALATAVPVRAAQEAGYSPARAAALARSAEAFRAAGGGSAGHAAAMEALRGELPKLGWGGFEHFDDNAVNAMINHVYDHPDLTGFDSRRAAGAITRAKNGITPTNSEIALLRKAFPTSVVDNVARGAPVHKTIQSLVNLINVPRAVMSSYDLSFIARQLLVAGARHPAMLADSIKQGLRGSGQNYGAIRAALEAHPRYQQALEMGLPLTDLEGPISKTEEAYIGHNFAEKIPVAGRGIKFSAQAYTTAINHMRMEMFDKLMTHAEGLGLDPYAPSRSAMIRHGVSVSHRGESIGQSIARYIGTATGRGDIGPLTKHATSLNALMFSPRLAASRFNLLSPAYYASLDPIARREALRSMAHVFGGVGSVLGLAKLAGANVNLTDPTNADWAKIRLGNTRIDLLGGLQQPIRLGAQLAEGKVTSSTTGKTLGLGPSGPGKLSRGDILQRFAESKLAPVPGTAWALAHGHMPGGYTPGINWGSLAGQELTPLSFQDAWSVTKHPSSFLDALAAYATHPSALPPTLAAYLTSALGVGVQSYAAKPPKTGGAPTSVDQILNRLTGGSGSSSTPGNVDQILKNLGVGG
jgi:hypothetical protein